MAINMISHLVEKCEKELLGNVHPKNWEVAGSLPSTFHYSSSAFKLAFFSSQITP